MNTNELQASWRIWVEKNIGGNIERQRAILATIFLAIQRGMQTSEIVSMAQAVALHYDSLAPAMALPVATPPHSSAPPREQTVPSGAGASGGILDIIAADRSPNGVATLQALEAIERKQPFRAKAFFATRGFRAGYGFYSQGPWVLLWPLLVGLWLVLPLLTRVFRVGGDLHQLLALAVGSALVLRLVFVACLTPLMASRARLEISKGRLMVTYGLLSTHQIPIEIHWIREAQMSATLVQKMLGECSVHISIDSPNRSTYVLTLPGPVAPSEATELIDRLRNAAQKVRQGNYYAKGFIA